MYRSSCLLDLSPASGRYQPCPETLGLIGVRHVMARRQQAARVDGSIVRRAWDWKKRPLQEQTDRDAEMPLSATEADDG
jgi:hypothetical protein